MGDFSKEVVNRFGCRSLAVEANPDNLGKIEESDHIKKFHYAIAPKTGTVELNLAGFPEGHSILNYGLTKEGSMTVPAITLADFMQKERLPAIDLLKMDIEGAEIRLLQDFPEALLRGIGQITCEFHQFIEEFNCARDIRHIKNRMAKMGFFILEFSAKKDWDVLFLNMRKYRFSAATLLHLAFIKYLYLPLRQLRMNVKNFLKERA